MTVPDPPHLPESISRSSLILIGPGTTRLLTSMGAGLIRMEPTGPCRLDLVR